MIYPIRLYGDSILRKKAEDIIEGNPDVKKLSDDMFDTMAKADGIGLAGPQIGLSKRIFVVDGKMLEEADMINFKQVFINPILHSESGDFWEFEEGCLSIPNIKENIFRKSEVEITYFDENWNKFTEKFSGMRARVIQHEYDHIEGKLFTDYLPSIKKKLIRSKLNEISKGKCDVKYKIKTP